MDVQKTLNSVVTGLLGLLLVGAAVYESVLQHHVDGDLLVLASAVVSVYFTGQAVRQVNGAKVEAMAASVQALHARFDTLGMTPAATPAIVATPTDPTPGYPVGS